MSDKERRTVTLSPQANRTLEQEDNASAVVNDLVEQYARTGDRGAAGLKLRRKHKLNELEEARERVARLESEVDELTALIDEREASEASEWDEAREALGALDDARLTAENPAVQNWSETLGVTPSELIEEVR
ncbi:hypothetical protein M1M40_gp15 [Halorubrum tailed virus 29]|uniref:Uncharacterized protein n=1 Tax=Halorubrum tailed virus 29 TaxID=2878010 RepID=A0AAE8Y1Q7_9CAUD|nr:hypothetical protein M1M40_gp15 [Halorubrum tailed virus 29]UBF23293.1 hypothetical protein HRTV-29_gp15 [Halorubrum tailed virus 29]